MIIWRYILVLYHFINEGINVTMFGLTPANFLIVKYVLWSLFASSELQMRERRERRCVVGRRGGGAACVMWSRKAGSRGLSNITRSSEVRSYHALSDCGDLDRVRCFWSEVFLFTDLGKAVYVHVIRVRVERKVVICSPVLGMASALSPRSL